MKIVKCPHCASDVNIAFKIVAITDKSPPPVRFPASWREYGGERFSEVYIKDPEYINKCIENDDIKDLLREGLEAFYNNIVRR